MYTTQSGWRVALAWLVGCVAVWNLLIVPTPVGGEDRGQKQIPVTSLTFTPDSVMPVSIQHVPLQIVVGESRSEQAIRSRRETSLDSAQTKVRSTGGFEDVREQVRIATVAAWSDQEWPAMELLVASESGFNPTVFNRYSQAGGLFQALPFSKTGCSIDDTPCQIDWGISYVRERYGSPSQAWAFHRIHNWY